MVDQEKTAAELAAEERELAIKRGDVIPEDEDEAVEGSPEELAADDDAEEVEEVEEEPVEAAADDESGKEGDADSPAEEASGEEKPIMIPKARFDEQREKANARLKEMEQRLAEAERQHAQKTTNADIEAIQSEIGKLEDSYEEFLLEGEVEKARAARKEVNAKRDELIERRLVQQSQQTGNAAVEQIRYETKLAMYETKYPAINPDSDAFNQETLEEVSELKAAFEARGWSSTAALEKAISYVPTLRQQDVEAEEESPDPSIKRDQRAHKARKAAAKAAKATPPDASKAGRDSDKGGKGDGLPDVSKMTPEQFSKLSDAELSKLRGDTLSSEEAV